MTFISPSTRIPRPRFVCLGTRTQQPDPPFTPIHNENKRAANWAAHSYDVVPMLIVEGISVKLPAGLNPKEVQFCCHQLLF